jgi:hypothetical protein
MFSRGLKKYHSIRLLLVIRFSKIFACYFLLVSSITNCIRARTHTNSINPHEARMCNQSEGVGLSVGWLVGKKPPFPPHFCRNIPANDRNPRTTVFVKIHSRFPLSLLQVIDRKASQEVFCAKGLNGGRLSFSLSLFFLSLSLFLSLSFSFSVSLSLSLFLSLSLSLSLSHGGQHALSLGWGVQQQLSVAVVFVSTSDTRALNY